MSHTTPPLGELLTMHETLFALNLPLAKNDHARLVAYRAEIDAQRAHVATLTAERDFLTRENAELREPIPCPSMFCPYERRALQAEADLAGLRQRQPATPVKEARAQLTNARLRVNDFHACATAEELDRWRTAQESLIDAAKAYALAIEVPLPRVGDGTETT